MKFPKSIREELGDLYGRSEELATEIKVLSTQASVTRSEDMKLTELLDEMDTVKKSITELRTKGAEEARSRAGTGEPGYDTFTHSTRTSADYNDVRGMKRDELRDTALRVLETSGKHLDARQGDRLDELLRSHSDDVDGSKIAQRLLITERSSYQSAFSKQLQGFPVFTEAEVHSLEEFRAMGESTIGSGGAGVPVMIDPTIILQAGAKAAPIIDISRIVTITTDAWKGVSSAAAPAWSYDAEGSAVSDDSMTLAQPNIPVYMGRGFVPFSIELGMDFPDFANELARVLSQGFIDLIANSSAVGTGSGMPTGIFTAMNNCTTNPGHIVVTTNGALGAVDVRAVYTALPERFRGRATWVMNPTTEEKLLSNPSALSLSDYSVMSLGQGLGSLLGRPVVISDYAPQWIATTTAASILVFGDFENFVIPTRAGMTIELVQNLFDVTFNRPTGQRGYFAYARHGSDSASSNSFRLLTNT